MHWEENKYQTSVFQGEHLSFTEANYSLSDKRTQEVVDDVIKDKEDFVLGYRRGTFVNFTKFSDKKLLSLVDKVRYDVYNIVEQSLLIDNGEIEGKEDLVNSLSILIKREEIQSKISTLESIKNNPIQLQNKVLNEVEIYDTIVDKNGELIVESKKIKK